MSEKVILNAEDSKKLVEALDNPPKPSEKLKALLEREAEYRFMNMFTKAHGVSREEEGDDL